MSAPITDFSEQAERRRARVRELRNGADRLPTGFQPGHPQYSTARFAVGGHPGVEFQPGQVPHNYAGDDVGYDAMHRRLPRGSACTQCGATGLIENALIKGRGTKQDKRGLWFSIDPADYQPMCVPCHRRYDRA